MKSFLSSLSLSLSLCLSGVGVWSPLLEHTNFDSSARPGWVTSNEVAGSLLPMSTAQHMLWKTTQKTQICFLIELLNQVLPLVLSWWTIDHLLNKVNKPARDLQVLAKGQDLTRHQQKMLIAMECPKFEDTKCTWCSAVICSRCKRLICQAYTEFCSRCKRVNFNTQVQDSSLKKPCCHCRYV